MLSTIWRDSLSQIVRHKALAMTTITRQEGKPLRGIARSSRTDVPKASETKFGAIPPGSSLAIVIRDQRFASVPDFVAPESIQIGMIAVLKSS